MKIFLKSSLIALVIALSSSAFALSDSEITSSIKSQIASDSTISDQSIAVSTKKGVVTLSGNVDTDAEASKAVEIASATAGVKDTVTSGLKVKESNQPFTDTAITAKVKGTFVREKLFGDKPVAVMSVNVETTNGVVHLSGTVESQAEADNAIKLAKSVSGVKSVESKIEVNPAS